MRQSLDERALLLGSDAACDRPTAAAPGFRSRRGAGANRSLRSNRAARGRDGGAASGPFPRSPIRTEPCRHARYRADSRGSGGTIRHAIGRRIGRRRAFPVRRIDPLVSRRDTARRVAQHEAGDALGMPRRRAKNADDPAEDSPTNAPGSSAIASSAATILAGDRFRGEAVRRRRDIGFGRAEQFRTVDPAASRRFPEPSGFQKRASCCAKPCIMDDRGRPLPRPQVNQSTAQWRGEALGPRDRQRDHRHRRAPITGS